VPKIDTKIIHPLSRIGCLVCRQASLVTLLIFSFVATLIFPGRGDSHDPVTTKVRFNKEIVRIFQRHCLACHNSGTITNISLATYAQARPWAKAFKEEVLERRMPPYQAVKGFGRFHDDYALTQREIDQIISWVEGGTPKGDDKDVPPSPPLGGWLPGQPDLVLEPATEVKIPAGEGDEYRCITLGTNLKEDRWVTAVDFHPGHGSAVHCATFAIELAQVRDKSDYSLDCAKANRLGIWIPGQAVSRLPANVARLLPAGARIVMRIHYHKTRKAVSDESALALYFAKDRTTKPLRTIALTAPETDIPAGVERHRIKASYTIPAATEAIAIRPLLFPFAKSIEVTAHRPDGTIEVLIWVKDHRYDWQPDYIFKKPVPLPQGTRIEVTAYLDNSDKNQNNPNSPARSVRFASALCELSLINVREKTW
jgi:hypothetical protein